MRLSSPSVHNQVVGFAYVEPEVVHSAPPSKSSPPGLPSPVEPSVVRPGGRLLLEKGIVLGREVN